MLSLEKLILLMCSVNDYIQHIFGDGEILASVEFIIKSNPLYLSLSSQIVGVKTKCQNEVYLNQNCKFHSISFRIVSVNVMF